MRCADGQWCNFLSVVHSICVVERLYRLILQIQIIDYTYRIMEVICQTKQQQSG